MRLHHSLRCLFHVLDLCFQHREERRHIKLNRGNARRVCSRGQCLSVLRGFDLLLERVDLLLDIRDRLERDELCDIVWRSKPRKGFLGSGAFPSLHFDILGELIYLLLELNRVVSQGEPQ